MASGAPSPTSVPYTGHCLRLTVIVRHSTYTCLQRRAMRLTVTMWHSTQQGRGLFKPVNIILDYIATSSFRFFRRAIATPPQQQQHHCHNSTTSAQQQQHWRSHRMIDRRNRQTAALRRSRDNIQHKKSTTALRITKFCANSLIRLTHTVAQPKKEKNGALGNSPTIPSIGAALLRKWKLVFRLPGSSIPHPVRHTKYCNKHFPRPNPNQNKPGNSNAIHWRCITVKSTINSDSRTRSKNTTH